MWQYFLDLLRDARRPLVVVDFETAGLSGAPPVEFALAYWAPWCPPADDPVSVRARAVCPPGLTYATTSRLDPGCPIDIGSTAIHGIRDEDVRGKATPYRDLEVLGLFQSLDAGDASQGEGRAVWCGHNAAEADVPWAKTWGYLPPRDDVAVLDTMRLRQRLGKEHPFPLCPDAVAMCGGQWRDMKAGVLPWAKGCPVIGHGLKPYAANLEGLHTALFGDPHDGGHTAIDDVCATARCLAAMLELWELLWPRRASQSSDPAVDLERLLAALDAPPPGQVSWDGWLEEEPPEKPRQPGLYDMTPRTAARYRWRRGKYEGSPAHHDQWILSLPRSPTGDNKRRAWCSPTTAAILEAL